MAIITAEHYGQVRAALDVSITTEMLPDHVIALPIYHAAGEGEVIRRVPDWATYTGTDAIRLRNAAVYSIAALIALALPAIESERTTDGQTYQRHVVDPLALAAALRARADAEIAEVIDEGDSSALIPTLFTVAPAGYRRRSRWSPT